MSRRRMKGPFGSTSILVVVFAVLLTAAGLIWAHWYTSLRVDANINTGNVAIEWHDVWTNDDGTVNGDFDPGDDGSNGMFTHWDDGSSPDPASFDGARYDKDVAACFAGGGGDHLDVSIENGYPSYHCLVQAGIHNPGSVPLKALASAWTMERGSYDCALYEDEGFTQGPLPIGGDDMGEFIDYDMNGEFSAGDVRLRYDEDGPYADANDNGFFDAGDSRLYEECFFGGDPLDWEELGGGLIGWGTYDGDTFVPEVTGFLPEMFACGYQIDPGFEASTEFGFHVEQAAEQGATYHFSLSQEFVNWNEFDDEACEGGIEVLDGWAPDFGDGPAARYRDLGEGNAAGEQELYVGWGDLGIAANRTVTDFVWERPGTYDLVVAFDGTDITASVDGTSQTFTDVTSAMSCAVTDLDRLQFLIRQGDAAGTVELNGVTLDGMPLGSFSGSGVWHVLGYDFSGGYTLSAQLVIDDPLTSSNEGNRVEFGVGCFSP